MLKLYTGFHVQERFSWSSFVICILKSTFRYVNTNIQVFQVLAFGKQYFFTFYWVYLAFWIHFIFLIWLVLRTTYSFYSLPIFLGLPWKHAVVISRRNLPQLCAVGICRSDLPWLCRWNLPQLFAVGICRSYLP